jgi:hypothetical protein
MRIAEATFGSKPRKRPEANAPQVKAGCMVVDQASNKAHGAYQRSSLVTARQTFWATITTPPKGPALAD